MKDRIDRIAERTGVERETVEFFADEFHHTNTLPIIAYLDRRIAAMRGDENPRHELDQIRLDLAALQAQAALKSGSEKSDEIL